MNWSRTVRINLDDPERKRELNEQLFRVIAPRYDLITRALSFGRDGAWKRVLMAELPDLPAPRCLDLACGTGDLTRLLAARYPQGHVTGIDLTAEMIALARQTGVAANMAYRLGDMSRLDAPDGSVDIVTGGYALRNAPRLADALAEVRRVLRPGGVAAFLDFSKPPQAAAQRVELALLGFWGGLWGLLLHGDVGVYGYIARSLQRFPDRQALHAQFAEAGLPVRMSRHFFAGIVEVTVARREAV